MPRAARMVEVTWLDAMRGEGSTDDAPARTFGTVRRTVGWMVSDQKAGVLIAMSKDGLAYERWFSIPRPYIMTVKDVKGVTIDADLGDHAGSPAG